VNVLGFIFYVLAAVMILSTLLAITRREVIHAVIYLIISFGTTGLLFYLLGAPFLAALEIIIYAGATMVLFLFVVMTVRIESTGAEKERLQWLPAAVLSVISFGVGALLIFGTSEGSVSLESARAAPAALGEYLFKSYWFPVEIASFLLLVALVGALYLGKDESKAKIEKSEKEP